MKNFIIKFFTVKGFLEKPLQLTPEQREKLVKQYMAYVETEVRIKVEMAFCKGLESFNTLSVQLLMNKERQSAIRVKLLKSCTCGTDHSGHILTEQKKKEMYRQQLEKYIHE